VIRFGRFEPAHARQLVAMVRAGAAVAGADPRTAGEDTLVIARSISDTAQAVLAGARMQCADERGRIDISLPAHGVLIRRAPDPSSAVAAKRRHACARSLSGPRAQRVAEVLCETALPLSVMRLSVKARVSRGYVSRVVAFLAAEDLVRHMPCGSVVRVEREALLRRWASDRWRYQDVRRPLWRYRHGARAAHERLVELVSRGAIAEAVLSGPQVAARWYDGPKASVLACYVADPLTAARSMRLERAEVGANVVLWPGEEAGVLEGRPTPRVGMVSASRACVDCLAGPEPMRVTGEWLLRRLCDPERTSEVARRIAWLDARDAELRAMRRLGLRRE
jgi:hypothetical protein